MLSFFNQNIEYMQEIIRKDREQSEMDCNPSEDWNSETPENSQEGESQEVVDVQWDIYRPSIEVQLAEKKLFNSFYRNSLFKQAESDKEAANILADGDMNEAQTILLYQQSAEKFLKGAYLCEDEEVKDKLSSGIFPTHALGTIAMCISNNYGPQQIEMQESSRNLEAIGKTAGDPRSLCVRSRYVNSDWKKMPDLTNYSFKKEDVLAARAHHEVIMN